ncbi:MAG TPA: AraC family transcriptional regulator [Pyrinomonadaceae bacterium]|nr:AraC family transcriptional regulator [Pyrinomonadaceae bacterium]
MDRRIEIVIAEMEAQISRSWTTAELAALVNLSESRFRHFFKHETGCTPAQFLRARRIELAEVFVRKTFLTIKQISTLVGLKSGSQLVREFKKVYGVTPTTYRQTRISGKR